MKLLYLPLALAPLTWLVHSANIRNDCIQKCLPEKPEKCDCPSSTNLTKTKKPTTPLEPHHRREPLDEHPLSNRDVDPIIPIFGESPEPFLKTKMFNLSNPPDVCGTAQSPGCATDLTCIDDADNPGKKYCVLLDNQTCALAADNLTCGNPLLRCIRDTRVACAGPVCPGTCVVRQPPSG